MSKLRQIPGVGIQVEKDLNNLGIFEIAQLKNNDPQKLYDKLCRLQKANIDRCMLYTLRCAVYFASNKTHKPELLKWWNWKD
jgi:Pathogenicity locus